MPGAGAAATGAGAPMPWMVGTGNTKRSIKEPTCTHTLTQPPTHTCLSCECLQGRRYAPLCERNQSHGNAERIGVKARLAVRIHNRPNLTSENAIAMVTMIVMVATVIVMVTVIAIVILLRWVINGLIVVIWCMKLNRGVLWSS